MKPSLRTTGRLGLTSRLNSATGGIEKLRAGNESKTSTNKQTRPSRMHSRKPSHPPKQKSSEIPKQERILRVSTPQNEPNPLNDPLNSEFGDDEMADDGEEFAVLMGRRMRL